MTISFLHPVLLLLLVVVPLFWFYPRHADNRVHATLRLLLLACVIVALARPVLLKETNEFFKVLILDRSASISAQQGEWGRQVAEKWAAEVDDKSKAGVVLIESGPDAQRSRNSAERSGLFKDFSSVVHLSDLKNSSSVSMALAAAERQIPEGSSGTITLVSDGLSTDRRWGRVVQRLVRRGITVNTVELPRDGSDLYPAGMQVSEILRVGQTALANVQVIGQAQALRVRLIDADGRQLGISKPTVSDGATTVPVEFEPRNAGFLSIGAEVICAECIDTDKSNNTWMGTLAIQQPLRMLYLGGRMAGGAERLKDLLGGSFAIEDGSASNLEGMTDLDAYDLVMIDDRAAAQVPEAFQERLANAVRETGLGLVFAGGKSAFGAGGYDGTTLAQTLPVEMQQKTEKRDPSTALALIIDTSGSMAGSRIELAKQVARLAVRRLKAHDRIGIVEFYGNKHWALPLQSAANKITIDRAIGRMQAIGGTVLYPAIEEAFYGLKTVATRYKHILIVTDAGIEDTNYEALIRRITRDNINVSTVLVGAQAHSQGLIDMASWGDGRFYSASNRYSLPEVILKQPSTMKLPAYKHGVFPVAARGAEGWWGSLDRSSLPDLSGYVETQARPEAEVLIEIQDGAQPILATWHYGLGRVTALMTEPVGPGTEGWSEWSGYGRLLSRIAQRTADDSQPFRYSLARDGNRVTLSARRYSSVDISHPQAFILNDEGHRGPGGLSFRQLAPGHFTAQWRVGPARELRISAGAVNALNSQPLGGSLTLVSPAFSDVANEHQVDPQQGIDLEGLAAATAGVVIDPLRPESTAPAATVRSEVGSLRLYPLWWYVLLGGLLTYLVELIYRRWPR